MTSFESDLSKGIVIRSYLREVMGVDEEIGRRMYVIYGLTEEEIEAVESS